MLVRRTNEKGWFQAWNKHTTSRPLLPSHCYANISTVTRMIPIKTSSFFCLCWNAYGVQVQRSNSVRFPAFQPGLLSLQRINNPLLSLHLKWQYLFLFPELGCPKELTDLLLSLCLSPSRWLAGLMQNLEIRYLTWALKTAVTSWEHTGRLGAEHEVPCLFSSCPAPPWKQFLVSAAARWGENFLPEEQGRSIFFAQPLCWVFNIWNLYFLPWEDRASRWAGMTVTSVSLPCTGLAICSQSFCNNSLCQRLWSKNSPVRQQSTKRNCSNPQKPANAPLTATPLPSPTLGHRPNSLPDQTSF